MKPEAKHGADCVKLLEPDLKRVLWSVRAHDLFHGSEREAEIAWEVAQLIEEFESESADSNCRSLWFTVERGSIDDWKTIEEFREYAEWEELEIDESCLEAERASEWESSTPMRRIGTSSPTTGSRTVSRSA